MNQCSLSQEASLGLGLLVRSLFWNCSLQGCEAESASRRLCSLLTQSLLVKSSTFIYLRCGNALNCENALFAESMVLWFSPQLSLVHSVPSASFHARGHQGPLWCSSDQEISFKEAQVRLAHALLLGRGAF